MRQLIIVMTASFFLYSCATSSSPLVYVSTQTLGIQIGTDVTQSGSVSLKLGFQNVDAAYVPTTVIDDKTGTTASIRGCYHSGVNVGRVDDCDSTGIIKRIKQATSPKPDATKPAEKSASSTDATKLIEAAASKTDASTPELVTAPKVEASRRLISPAAFVADSSGGGGNVFAGVPIYIKADEAAPAPDPTEGVGSVSVGASDNTDHKAGPVNAKATDGQDTKLAGSQHQSINDSLSVFGSFDSDTKAGSTSSISIGKVFATGVAAQHLAEGINLSERRKATASIISNTSNCIKELKNTLADKVTVESLTICQ